MLGNKPGMTIRVGIKMFDVERIRLSWIKHCTLVRWSTRRVMCCSISYSTQVSRLEKIWNPRTLAKVPENQLFFIQFAHCGTNNENLISKMSAQLLVQCWKSRKPKANLNATVMFLGYLTEYLIQLQARNFYHSGKKSWLRRFTNLWAIYSDMLMLAILRCNFIIL